MTGQATRRPRPFRERIHGWIPFGLGETKPHHFTDMLKIVWRNRDNLGHAWKVLSRGTCDGCALGTTGMKDWTVKGTHLCMVRLELLRLNTMGALDHQMLGDVERLKLRSSKQLRELGRLAYPMRRRKGERGFKRVSWKELWRDVGQRWSKLEPERTSMYLTSRGITNEVYYTAQKVMRYLGSSHVDNAARLCHSPSTAGLKATVGVAATTCSYKDWYSADLIIFFGSNPANDQPVSLKYLHEAKKRGARVLVVNAYREPGMERYWVPSNADSAVFGSRIADEFFLVKIGGDLAFLNAVQKVLIDRGVFKQDFIDEACENFDEYVAALQAQDMQPLLERAGVERSVVEALADEIAAADRGVCVWSMGITQHAQGADTVAAIANLGLLREWVGREGCGLMPIRGHSGVQGGAEMGAYATVLPGGLAVNRENAAHFSKLWGFSVPDQVGHTTVEQLEAALQGKLDAFYCIGGNFLETMPEPERMAQALSKIPLRLHVDIVVTSQMMVEPEDEDGVVYLLPAATRYEQKDGGTETTTERRVVLSPEIPGHQVGEARSEWELLLQLAQAVRPDDYERVHFDSGAEIRADIARAVPFYAGIEKLEKQGDQFQWGGKHLCADRKFPTASGKAHFKIVRPNPRRSKKAAKASAGSERPTFLLATRRGKQFNSMIQQDRDPITGAERDHIFMAHEDARELGIRANQRITLRSEVGSFRGRAFPVDAARGTLQGHWPEVNVLIAHGVLDAGGGVPDYNAEVTLEI